MCEFVAGITSDRKISSFVVRVVVVDVMYLHWSRCITADTASSVGFEKNTIDQYIEIVGHNCARLPSRRLIDTCRRTPSLFGATRNCQTKSLAVVHACRIGFQIQRALYNAGQTRVASAMCKKCAENKAVQSIPPHKRRSVDQSVCVDWVNASRLVESCRGLTSPRTYPTPRACFYVSRCRRPLMSGSASPGSFVPCSDIVIGKVFSAPRYGQSLKTL